MKTKRLLFIALVGTLLLLQHRLCGSSEQSTSASDKSKVPTDEDYVASLMRSNLQYGSSSYRRMVYSEIGATKATPPTPYQIANGLYGFKNFFRGGPEHEAAKKALADQIAELSSSNISPEAFAGYAAAGVEEINRLEQNRIFVSQERDAVKELLGDLGGGIGGILPGTNPLKSLANPAIKFFGADLVVNHIPGLSEEAKLIQETALTAQVLTIYNIAKGNLKLTVPKYFEHASFEPLQKALQAIADSRDIETLRDPKLRKEFLEAPEGQRATYLLSVIEVVNRVVVKHEAQLQALLKDPSAKSPLADLTFEDVAKLRLLEMYSESRLKGALAELATKGGQATSVERQRIESIRQTHEALGSNPTPNYSAIFNMIREQGGLQQSPNQNDERVSFIMQQLPPEARLDAHNRGIQVVSAEEAALLQEQVYEREKLKTTRELQQNVELATASAGVVIDSAVVFGNMNPKQANQLKSGIAVAGGIAMAAIGVYTGNPMLVVGGISSFVSGMGSLMQSGKGGSDLNPLAEYLQTIHADLTRQIGELRGDIWDLNSVVLRSHKSIIDKLDREFAIVKFVLTSIQGLEMSAQEKEYFGKSSLFSRRIAMAATQLKLIGSDTFYTSEEIRNLLNYSHAGDLPLLWKEAFEGLNLLLTGNQSHSLPTFLQYGIDEKSSVPTGAEEQFDFVKQYHDTIGLLTAEYATAFKAADQNKLINALAYRSPDAVSLITKATKLSTFQDAPALVQEHFATPVSPRRIQAATDYLVGLYPFSFFVSPQGKFMPVNQQLLPLLESLGKEPTSAESFNGPGSSVLYYETLEQAKKPLLLALAQQSVYSGDLLLILLDLIIDSNQENRRKALEAKPEEIASDLETYRKCESLFNSNRLLAMNFLMYRIFKRAIWDSQNNCTKYTAVSQYEQAHSAQDARIVETWLAQNKIFDDESMDSNSIQVKCWEELEVLREVEIATQDVQKLRNALSMNSATAATSIAAKGKQLEIAELEKKIVLLKTAARNKRNVCSTPATPNAFKWYLSLSASTALIPMPTPEDLGKGGQLHSSVTYNSLAGAWERINFVYSDMKAPTTMSKETLSVIDNYLLQSVLDR